MSGRSRVSSRVRPRTRMYDSNFAIGESYYKDALDRIDRKYSGKPTSPARSSLPKEISERHSELFADEDLPSARRRAEKIISEDNMFDMSKMRPLSTVMDTENGFDDEISNSLQKIQQRRKQLAAKMAEDVDMENISNNLAAKRMVSRTERTLDSVGLNENTAKKLFNEESSSIRKRVIKVTATSENASTDNNYQKWTALNDEGVESSAAAIRARKSQARLNDLNEEMEQMAERQAARERRLVNLRALMAENAEESEALQMKTARLSSRSEKKVVTF